MPSTPVHLLISTHTTRHLAPTLRAAGAQSVQPESIVVTCDSDDTSIALLVREVSANIDVPIILMQRAHTGRSRSSQVRNNGVRALLKRRIAPESLLAFLDGDCVPSRDLIEMHARRCPPGALSIGFRFDLTAEQTEAFDGAALAAGRPPVPPLPEQTAGLLERARRYRRQAALRRLGLAKAHKPKLLSANFAVRLFDYLAVNGFDEEYEGYGQEDDDLGRRLYRHGCRPVVSIEQAVAYHLFHATRAPGDWHESPNAARFRAGGPTRCRRGVENPVEQPAVSVTCFTGHPHESAGES